jgi:hypothetical protein
MLLLLSDAVCRSVVAGWPQGDDEDEHQPADGHPEHHGLHAESPSEVKQHGGTDGDFYSRKLT